MKFSIITPTHDPKYLDRLAASLEAQTFKDFEWVIIPNGKLLSDANPIDVFLRFNKVPNTLCHFYDDPNTNIGAIKNFGFNKGIGEILVELDHDDELTPDCLEELAKAFEDPDVDFVYSNCVELTNDKDSGERYDRMFGWDYRIYNDEKRGPLTEYIAFPPTPASFSKIWYAPNHIRAWRKDFYKRIGGHDITLDVCDDHDIVCRTYIHGNVKHIDKCLYIYHLHPDNTCYSKEKNKRIQELTLQLHDKYIYQLAEKWCDLNSLLKIDLCGGFSKPKGYLSVDLQGGDITWDLNDPYKMWPFQDGEVGVFRAHDALEHLSNKIHVIKQIYRCLAPQGWLLSFTPSTDGRGAFQDPTHSSFYNSNSFFYYTRSEQAKYIGTPVRFQDNLIKNYYPNKWAQDHNILYVKADLLKLTDNDGRIPGLKKI